MRPLLFCCCCWRLCLLLLPYLPFPIWYSEIQGKNFKLYLSCTVSSRTRTVVSCFLNHNNRTKLAHQLLLYRTCAEHPVMNYHQIKCVYIWLFHRLFRRCFLLAVKHTTLWVKKIHQRQRGRDQFQFISGHNTNAY